MDLILGYRRTGKTTKLIKYIVDWQYTHNGIVLLGSPFYNDTIELVRKLTYGGMTGIRHIHPCYLENLLGYNSALVAIDELGSLDNYSKRNLAYIDAIPGYDFVATWSLN